MATIKQKMAVKRIVENHGNISKSMKEVGYDDTTAKNPSNLTNSKGFLELCDELGLTDNLIVNSLVEDIKGKPLNRKPELELATKMRGRLIDRTDLTTGGDKLTLKDLTSEELNAIISKSGISSSSSIGVDTPQK